MNHYAYFLIQGINSAARENCCNLFLGCGFSNTGKTPLHHSFWPMPGNSWDLVNPALGNNWENQVLFDFDGMLPVLSLYREY